MAENGSLNTGAVNGNAKSAVTGPENGTGNAYARGTGNIAGSRVGSSPMADISEHDAHVAEAIAEARQAAQSAGMSYDTDNFDADARLAGHPTSLGLHLTGIESGAQAREIERILNGIEGVQAKVIYNTGMAWLTAPSTMDPQAVVQQLAVAGIEARVTPSSMRRRATALGERPVPKPAKRARFRSRREIRQQWGQPQRAEGFLEHFKPKPLPVGSDIDVLYTARELITKWRLAVTLVLALPVLVISYEPRWQFDYWQWLCLVLATPVVFYGGWPFHRAMVAGLRRRLPALDSASSFAILGAYIWSLILLANTSAGDPTWRFDPQWFAIRYNRIANGELFLDVACGMTLLLLAGRLFVNKSGSVVFDAAATRHIGRQLSHVVVTRKTRTGQVTKEITRQEIRVGDDLEVPAGAIVPADGVVIGGGSQVELGLIGGSEGYTAPVKVNSKIYAGSVNLDAPVKMRVQSTGSRTRLAAIKNWVAHAATRQSTSAQVATRSAAWLVPWGTFFAVVVGAIWWLILGNMNAAFATMLAILACLSPVSLAMSTNIATRMGIETAARQGMLLRSGETLRQLAQVDTVIFNRVGTLAEEDFAVKTVTAQRGENPDLVLRVAAALALESDHPVFRAIVRADREARDRDEGSRDVPHWLAATGVTMDDHGNFRGLVEIPLRQPDGNFEDAQVEALLWRPTSMRGLDDRIADAVASGGSPLVVSWRGKPRGVITLLDHVRDDAVEAVADLNLMRLETVMLTRDTYPVARRGADNLGIHQVLAGITPENKPGTVRSVHAAGRNVAMVGDKSVTECLKVADVGILMGVPDSFEDDDADVVLLRKDVGSVPDVIGFGRRVSQLVQQNIFLAWTYNTVAIACAAAGLLHPMGATIAMVASSLIIQWRSLRFSIARRPQDGIRARLRRSHVERQPLSIR